MLVKLNSCNYRNYISKGERQSCLSIQGTRNRVRRNKLAARKRMATAAILIIIFFGILLFTTNAYGSEPITYETVVVEQGDSLWGIARSYCGSGRDIRVFINKIIELNNIEDDYIFPGMVLKIPVEKL